MSEQRRGLDDFMRADEHRDTLARHNRALRQRRLSDARRKGRHTEQEWRELVARYGGRCVRCGSAPTRLERDHIVPIYQGGSDGIGNIQPLCRKCNGAKGPEDCDWRAYRDRHGWNDAD